MVASRPVGIFFTFYFFCDRQEENFTESKNHPRVLQKQQQQQQQ